MTDNFLHKLEEKVMVLLTELETLRKELQHLRQENTYLKAEQQNYTKKLQGLVSLLDSLDITESGIVPGELKILKVEKEYAEA